jgi:MinD-like ATPase involved in chromosome partitioning or flagellar assembly
VLKQKGTIQCGAHSLDVLAIRVFNATSDLIASRTILDTLSHQRAKHDYDYIVVDFHSTEETADMESALSAMEKIVVVAEASRTALDNLKTALRPVPSDKVSSLLLNKA